MRGSRDVRQSRNYIRKKPAILPLAKPAIRKGTATDEKFEIDSNFYTAQTENSIWTMTPQLMEALK